MVGNVFLSIITNAMFFSCIFWTLTFLAKYLYTNKYYNYKSNFYECGFSNTSNKFSYEINFALVVLFILIYDGEFLLLTPFLLNADILSVEIFLAIFFFFFWFIAALLFDYAYNALEWQL